MNDYLTIKEVSKILKVTVPMVHIYRKKHFKFTKIDGVLKVNVKDFLASVKINSTDDEYKVRVHDTRSLLIKRQQGTDVDYKKAIIKFLMNGIKTSDEVPSKFISELRQEMDILQDSISEIEYLNFMAECFGSDETEIKEIKEKIGESNSRKFLYLADN
jgi:hypothetical protein